MTRKRSHVLIGNVRGGYVAWCENCGGQQRLTIPEGGMALSGRGSFVAWMNGRIKEHRACPRPAAPFPAPAEVVAWAEECRAAR